MHLLVIRHAIAEARSPDLDDSDRELTRDGIRKLKDVVQGLRELDWKIDRILTSPWKRALHTAELLAQIAELDSEVCAVVGHEPWLGELVGWLAFGDPKHGEQIDFKKAGVIWLDGSVSPRGMKLRAHVPPKVFRELA